MSCMGFRDIYHNIFLSQNLIAVFWYIHNILSNYKITLDHKIKQQQNWDGVKNTIKCEAEDASSCYKGNKIMITS